MTTGLNYDIMLLTLILFYAKGEMMTRYKKVVRVLEDSDVEAGDLMTMKEAADALGVTVAAVSIQSIRGQYTVIEDTEAPLRQGRRLLLRSEVEERLSRVARFDVPLDVNRGVVVEVRARGVRLPGA